MVERGREMSYIESRMVYQENKKIQIKKKMQKKNAHFPIWILFNERDIWFHELHL